jgi:hypothetical protein
MFSMTMATLGWAIVWIDLALARLAPGIAPSLPVASWIAFAFGSIGFVAAMWGIRARLAWLLVLLVPVLANGTLLAAPWLLSTLRVVDAQVHAQEPPSQE